MLNTVTLQGRLTKDIEIRAASNGNKYSIFTIAVQRNYKGKDGKYNTDFIDCFASDKIAEHIAKFFHKGSEIIISGELQTTEKADENGQKRKSTLVCVGKVFFTSGKSEPQATAPVEATTEPTESGELPFEQ